MEAKEAETGRRVGIYPELKHPDFLLQQGFDTVDLLVTALRQADLDEAEDAVFIQSFEVGTLRRLNTMVEVPLVLLVTPGSGPADEPALSYEEMLTPAGLAEVAKYADAIGADLRLVFNADGTPTGLVEKVHGAGLKLHGWTLRKENAFLPPALRRGSAENAAGDVPAMVALLRAAGLDGVFTDDPGLVVPAMKAGD